MARCLSYPGLFCFTLDVLPFPLSYRISLVAGIFVRRRAPSESSVVLPNVPCHVPKATDGVFHVTQTPFLGRDTLM